MIDRQDGPAWRRPSADNGRTGFPADAAIKLFVFTRAGAMHYFASLGLPGWFGLFIIAAEGAVTLPCEQHEITDL
jgi:hypothetical protein